MACKRLVMEPWADGQRRRHTEPVTVEGVAAVKLAKEAAPVAFLSLRWPVRVNSQGLPDVFHREKVESSSMTYS
jgi:hypothetical protein